MSNSQSQQLQPITQWPAFLGLLPPSLAGRYKDPFVYTINLTVAASSSSSTSTQIQADSDFVWTKAAAVVTDSATGLVFTAMTTVPALLQLNDSGSGRNLQDAAVAVSAWFGTAQLPFELVPPKIFRRNSQLSATIQNQSAGSLIFRLAFHGFKVFDFQMEG